MVNIRSATFDDADDIWRILEPVLRAGETCACDYPARSSALIPYRFCSSTQSPFVDAIFKIQSFLETPSCAGSCRLPGQHPTTR